MSKYEFEFIIFAVFLLGWSIYLICYASLQIWRGYKSFRWNKTTCTIISSYAQPSKSWQGFVMFYTPIIRYKYTVNKQKYIGFKIAHNKSWKMSEKYAKEICEFYSTGSLHSVSIDPENSIKSVLNNGIKFFNIIIMIFGLCILYFLWQVVIT